MNAGTASRDNLATLMDPRLDERLLADPLSETCRRERRALLLFSLILLAFAYGGVKPTKIEQLGVQFSSAETRSLTVLLIAVHVYFLCAFIVYASAERTAWLEMRARFEGEARAAVTHHAAVFKNTVPKLKLHGDKASEAGETIRTLCDTLITDVKYFADSPSYRRLMRSVQNLRLAATAGAWSVERFVLEEIDPEEADELEPKDWQVRHTLVLDRSIRLVSEAMMMFRDGYEAELARRTRVYARRAWMEFRLPVVVGAMTLVAVLARAYAA